jgi:hypothetical protein
LDYHRSDSVPLRFALGLVGLEGGLERGGVDGEGVDGEGSDEADYLVYVVKGDDIKLAAEK